jgi:RimJ/RimL family protein N-acetyltransferase
MINFGHDIKLAPISYQEFGSVTWKWRNDYSIWKWCRQNDLLSYKSHAAWFDKIGDDPTIKMYSIIDFKGTCVGICGLTDIDRVNQRAEFSLYIGPEYQRLGHAKAALKTLLSHGFLNQNLNVIWGETFEGNHAFEMFLCLGMTHEGCRQDFYYKDGKFIDANLVSITKNQFMEQSWKKSQE